MPSLKPAYLVTCRSTGKDITELNEFVRGLVARINTKYSTSTYKPVVWLDRPVPLYEKIALYSIADVAVVTATRDGMNLVPYEYIVCREGPEVLSSDAYTCRQILGLICVLIVKDAVKRPRSY